ncbi:hypothetical protein BT69DRAFT_1280313 [Atractiella rhizophila]|nr:hypothetical protein BT69DRAFT_1280313 [Atractiella rhizophila]
MAPKQVALVGAGSLGSMILRELLKVPDLYTPIILTRKPSSRTDVPASQIRVIDYTSSSSLKNSPARTLTSDQQSESTTLIPILTQQAFHLNNSVMSQV